MAPKRRLFLIIFILLALLAVTLGFTVPLGTYTSVGCPSGDPPQIHLHLILGESIQKIKDNERPPLPNEGCSLQAQYTQYVL